MFNYDKRRQQLILKFSKFKISISFNLAKFIYKHLRFMLIILDYILPKNDKKVIFNSIPDYSDNGHVFYEYMKNNTNNRYKLYWILNGFKTDKKYDNSFYFQSFIGLFHVLTSKYVIATHPSQMIDVLCSKRRVLFNLWHGMPFKTIGFTEPDLNKTILKRYQILGKKGYTFATSDIFKQLLISSFKADYNRVFITGQPRTDLIMSDKNQDKIERLFNFSKYKKVVLYMPTYKTSTSRVQQIDVDYENIFYMDDYEENSFVKYLEDNNVLFLMKPHPFDEKFYLTKLDTMPKSGNFRIVYGSDFIDNDLNTYEIFKYVDLMISDFSSVTVDYAILNRPVIYLNNLSGEYNKNRGMILEDNTDLLMAGVKVSSFKLLLEEITNNLEFDSKKVEREKILPLLHKYPDDKACERIYEIMKSL